MRWMNLLLLGIGFVATSGAAHAGTVTFGFNALTSNNAPNVVIGQSQLKMTVSSMGADVNFRFFHMGTNPAAIAQIYFDDRTPRLGTAMLTPSGSGVAFSPNGSPPNVPGGNNASPAFFATKRFTADAPPSQKAVNPGEHLDIKFTLLTGDFDALIAAMGSGALRVGIHVQAFTFNGGSESFINEQPPPSDSEIIPLPTAANMAIAGMGLLAAGRRRRIN